MTRVAVENVLCLLTVGQDPRYAQWTARNRGSRAEPLTAVKDFPVKLDALCMILLPSGFYACYRRPLCSIFSRFLSTSCREGTEKSELNCTESFAKHDNSPSHYKSDDIHIKKGQFIYWVKGSVSVLFSNLHSLPFLSLSPVECKTKHALNLCPNK